MAIDAKTVAQLREMTGAGMMDAKKALEETGGDLTKAAEELRKKGVIKAAKKAERATNQGRVHAYIHSNGKMGALVEVLCETDFVARNQTFIDFCNDLAMHVCAANPQYLAREVVPSEVVEKEKAMCREELAGSNKPAEVIEKIIEGKLNKWYEENVLLDQPYIKDDTKKVGDYMKEKIATIGENMKVNKFCRLVIG
jgi:elongation factor Ts